MKKNEYKLVEYKTLTGLYYLLKKKWYELNKPCRQKKNNGNICKI